MSFEEYKSRLLEIRVKVNELCDDLGSTYSTSAEVLERVLNVAMNGNFEEVKGDKVQTHKIITITDFRNWNKKPEYI